MSYFPLHNPNFVGGIKIADREIDNQSFYDLLFTKFISFSYPLDYSARILIKVYSDNKFSNEIGTIDSTVEKDKKLFYKISNEVFTDLSYETIGNSYLGKPVYVDLQKFTDKIVYLKVTIDKKVLYGIHPSVNIWSCEGGHGGTSSGEFNYEGFFRVEKAETVSGVERIFVNYGQFYLNNQKRTVSDLYLQLPYKYLYSKDLYYRDDYIVNSNGELINPGEYSDKKNNQQYISNNGTYELRLVIEKDGSFYYTFESNDRVANKNTDRLIATIEIKEGSVYKIIQQNFGEIEAVI